ncbi:MAG: type III-B CRISPR module-associated Cmr3 family protein, partial [Spirochaetota bacterium]
MIKFTINPYDVLFFGSGKPFNKGGNAKSIFPPFPNSIASSIFAKFYIETGIKISEEQGI